MSSANGFRRREVSEKLCEYHRLKAEIIEGQGNSSDDDDMADNFGHFLMHDEVDHGIPTAQQQVTISVMLTPTSVLKEYSEN